MTSKAMVAGGDYSAGGCKRQMAGLKCPVGTQKRLRQRESLRRVVPLVRVARCGATGSCALTKSAQENTGRVANPLGGWDRLLNWVAHPFGFGISKERWERLGKTGNFLPS